jgi:hypothetical protein
MKRKPKRTAMWVIFASPQQFKGPNRYIDSSGSVTHIATLAAKFYSRDEAAEFAKKKNIELTEICYIGREDFTEREIQHDKGN